MAQSNASVRVAPLFDLNGWVIAVTGIGKVYRQRLAEAGARVVATDCRRRRRRQLHSIWGTDPIYIKRESNYYFYQNDHLGTPQKLMAQNGQVVWAATMEAFGSAAIDSASTVIQFLFEHQEQPHFVHPHDWTPGDLMLWDNRCIPHAHTVFSPKERRRLSQVIIKHEHAAYLESVKPVICYYRRDAEKQES